jgi:hypothetical protein
VRVNRAGTLVTDEDLNINLTSSNLTSSPGPITLTVDNGDNLPLEIRAVQPLSLERRVYFDPKGKALLLLYYGDEKLSAPVYDYARFFHLDASAAEAQLGAGGHNEHYNDRPDERPWSQRHMAMLWAAMLLAVLALAALAIRGLGSQTAR